MAAGPLYKDIRWTLCSMFLLCSEEHSNFRTFDWALFTAGYKRLRTWIKMQTFLCDDEELMEDIDAIKRMVVKNNDRDATAVCLGVLERCKDHLMDATPLPMLDDEGIVWYFDDSKDYSIFYHLADYCQSRILYLADNRITFHLAAKVKSINDKRSS